MKRAMASALSALLIGVAAPALAQHAHDASQGAMDHGSMNHGSMDHGSMGHGSVDHGTMNHGAMTEAPSASMNAVAATEPGQGAFATIAEIVQILQADPSTDWSQVDIDGLRAHLQDMAAVTLHAEAGSEEIAGGARFMITGEGAVADSVRRMTVAHAPFLDTEPWLSATGEATETGAILTVTAERPEDAQKIRALGYFGLMSLGAHHQEHHLMMARGMGHH